MMKPQAWLPDLPPPPREVYQLMRKANEQGYWLKFANDEHVRREHGGRYRITRPQGDFGLIVTDDLDAIAEWLAVCTQGGHDRC